MDTAAEAIAKGYQARKEGNLSLALKHYAEGAGLLREHNDFFAYAHAIRHVADIYRQQTKFLEAKALYEEALEIYRSSLDTKLLDLANTVRPYVLLNEELGNLESAGELWSEARNLYASLRIHEGVAECGAHADRLQQS